MQIRPPVIFGAEGDERRGIERIGEQVWGHIDMKVFFTGRAIRTLLAGIAAALCFLGDASAQIPSALSGTALTDKEIAELSGRPALRELRLLGAAVTDEGVKHLAGMTQLQKLTLASSAMAGQTCRNHEAPAVGQEHRTERPARVRQRPERVSRGALSAVSPGKDRQAPAPAAAGFRPSSSHPCPSPEPHPVKPWVCAGVGPGGRH